MSITAQASAIPPTATATVTSTPTSTATIFALPTFSMPTATTYSSAVGCNDSAFVADVTIPDNTILAPGETFTKTWQLYNSGTCTWDTNYSSTFTSGSDMDGDTTNLSESVSSGNSGNVSVILTAPETAGTYTGYWRLANESGTVFGQSFYVQIIVSGNAATSTPTSTLIHTHPHHHIHLGFY